MRTQQEVNNYLQDTTIKNAMNLLDIEKCLANDGLQLPNNVIIHRDGIGSIDFIKWFENKPVYPKTYEDCCQYIGCEERVTAKILVPFTQLLNARNAYWKIAGEQMGLNKPWEPDWNDEDEYKYGFFRLRNIIYKDSASINPTLLAFPTDEMRDTFYENFKYLIEQCKELL